VLFYRAPVIAFFLLVIAFAGGCDKTRQTSPPLGPPAQKTTTTVRVLVVDDRPLANTIRREWTARSGSPIDVSEATTADLLSRARLQADVIVYPAGLLGELASVGRVVPLSLQVQSHEQVARADIPVTLWQGEIRWGEQVVALPLGSPQFCLFYRRDILDKLGIEPPLTWLEYQRAVEQIRQRRDVDSMLLANVEPLASGWAGQLLLARAAAYVRHPNNYSALFRIGTLEPLIAGPPFVRALDELKSSSGGERELLSSLTPAKTLELFLRGRAIFAISWPQRIDLPEGSPELAADKIGVAPLPGAEQVYDVEQDEWQQRSLPGVTHVPLLGIAGRLGSVTSEARQTKAAVDVLVMLTGGQWSGSIASGSNHTAPFRSSHNVGSWVDKSLSKSSGLLSKVLKQSQSAPRWIHSPRLPGRSRYLAALDSAVTDVLVNDTAADAALGKAAHEWQIITQDIGIERQKKAHQQSLGLEP